MINLRMYLSCLKYYHNKRLFSDSALGFLRNTLRFSLDKSFVLAANGGPYLPQSHAIVDFKD